MKYFELQAIVEHLRSYKVLTHIHRIDETLFELEFDKKQRYFFLMQKSNVLIYTQKRTILKKSFQAPFDVVLKKRLNGATIEKLELESGNKIIHCVLQNSKSYKALQSHLYFECTNKNPNVIITDENNTIVSALRYIDSRHSYREVVQNRALIPLEPIEFVEKTITIENIGDFLQRIGEKKFANELLLKKQSKINLLQKKINKLQQIYDSLEDEKANERKAKEHYELADLILANLHLIKAYQQEVTLIDFENKERSIQIPAQYQSPSLYASSLYQQAKRYKQKAINGKIERKNIEQKKLFLKRTQRLVQDAHSAQEVELLVPSKKTAKSNRQDHKLYEKFEYEGYIICVGKSEKSNAQLLKDAKASDMWLHLKDIPSSHVIIKTNKQSLPRNVLEFAAKLCVNLSVDTKGTFLVDFTQRRNVKVRHSSFVNYVAYDTIAIKRD